MWTLLKMVQKRALELMRGPVIEHARSAMTNEDLIRTFERLTGQLLRAGITDYEASWDESGGDRTRLSFEAWHAEAAIRYQIFDGETHDGIADYFTEQGRARIEASNLGKIIRDFLKAVEIAPRSKR